MHRSAFLLVLLALTASAATLQQMSLDEMIVQSTQIVCGKITATSAAFRGTPGRSGMIYTHYTIAVSERYKGSGAASLDVVVPGGTAGGYRQVFAGAPALNTGDEFVFILWTSRSGLTQIIGLTQGLFSLAGTLDGKQVLSRSSGPDVMINPATGAPVTDSGMTITVDELKRRIAALPAGPKVGQ